VRKRSRLGKGEERNDKIQQRRKCINERKAYDQRTECKIYNEWLKEPTSELKKEEMTKTENKSFGLSSAIWILEFRKCILLAVVFRCTNHVTHHGIILDLVTWTAVSPALLLNNH